MGRDRAAMGPDAPQVVLNLGCGFNKMPGALNVDAFDICNPDMVVDLNTAPWPWADNSVDQIFMHHVMEHIPNWWEAFTECGRILKIGGMFQMAVPDESSGTALSYRDHHHVFTMHSFHGAFRADGRDFRAATNAWAATEQGNVPLAMVAYTQVPFMEYSWMARWCPWLLRFCANHMRNFVKEQIFTFQRLPDREATNGRA